MYLVDKLRVCPEAIKTGLACNQNESRDHNHDHFVYGRRHHPKLKQVPDSNGKAGQEAPSKSDSYGGTGVILRIGC